VYDFEYEKGEGKRNKLCFYAWCVSLSLPSQRLLPLGPSKLTRTWTARARRSPDEAKIKDKMLYASSKDALRRSLVGIASEIQGTDSSEVAYDEGPSFVLALSVSTGRPS